MRALVILRSLIIVPVLCLSVSWLATATAVGQDPFNVPQAGDDPFAASPQGMSADPFGGGQPAGAAPQTPFGGFGQTEVEPAAPGDDATAAQQTLDSDPVVRYLQAAWPSEPQGVAEGITWMVRIKRWDIVRDLLDSAAAAQWSLEQQAELAKAAGPSIWMRVESKEAGLSETQRQWVQQVAAAPAALARDATWLQKWSEQLASGTPGQRRLAQLRLQDGGAVAIVHLVDQLLDGDGPVEPAMLAGTIAEFGPDGIEALKAACMVRDPQRLSRVLLALAELPSKQFSVELGAGLASGVLPAERQAELAERLNDKYGKLPSLPAIHAFLNKSFDRELAQYQVSRTTQGGLFDTIWRPTPDRRSVQLVEGQTQDRRLEAVARLAVHRLQLSLTTPGESVDCGAVLLQRAYQSHASMELGEVEGHLLTRLPEAQTREAGYWIQVFERADEWQMHGGAIRALQMLVASAPGEYLVPLDFLSELLNDSRPVIRYTALQSLYELDPQSPYLGAEKALAVAMEMTQLAGGPQPLVVGLQSELRQAAQQQLKMQTGTSGLSANSARNALLALAGTTPIEIIVIVDRVADQSLFEFLQRLRSSQKAQSLPIAVLTDELYQHERQWIENTPGIVSGVLSRNPEYMGRVVQRLYDTLDTAPLSAGDRAHFAAVSSRFLTRLASNRDKYAFYPLADWSGHLEALGENVSLETQLTVLAGIGSAVSQRKLSALAANSALPAADRYEAARALGKSVRRFGMNLTEQDVLQTYELYNTLGPGDPAAAKSLGLALDVLEAYAGKGAWPEGL